MSDIIQVADLEKTKFHNTFHVEAVTGKVGGLAGGADIEYTTNAVTGQVQKTLPKILADIDWSYVGLFADGVTFTKSTDFALDAVGIQWAYVGTYPFTATAGTIPSEPLYQVVHVGSLQNLSGLEDPSKLDNVYRRAATVSQVENGDFEIGALLSLTDRDDAPFNIVTMSSYIVNGIDILSAGDGKVAIKSGKTYSLSKLGAKTTGDSTSVIQRAFDSVVAFDVIDIDTVCFVSHALMDGKTDISFTGSGAIIGNHTNLDFPLESVIEFKNCTGLKSLTKVAISGTGTESYDGGVKIWAEDGRTTSLHDLDFSVTNVKQGWLFGDESAPDALLSEIRISGGHTFNCPIPLSIYGSQAVIEADGYQLISDGKGDLAGLPHRIAVVTGGVLHVNGGECQMTTQPTGIAFQSMPINSPLYPNAFGSVYLNGTALESRGAWFLASNAKSIPSPAPNTGAFVLENSHGYHNFSGTSIQGDAVFSGKIHIGRSNNFHAPSIRSDFTADCQGAAKIFIAEEWSNGYFREGIYGINRGVALFDTQNIISANNLNSQNFPESIQTILKFSTIPPTAENLHFYDRYNTATGVFKVPQGGLKDVNVSLQLNTIAAHSSSEIYCFVNGLTKGFSGNSSKLISVNFVLGNLDENDEITIAYQGIGAGSGWTADTSNLNKMSITARR